jgi:putative phosphoesterase
MQMKILVISDSHGRTDNIQTIVNKTYFDKIFFLGDYINDMDHITIDPSTDVIKVRGNLDRHVSGLDDVIVKIEDVKILLTHGHRLGVKFDLYKLYLKAKQEECDIAFYGHTHQYKELQKNDVLIANPGSIAKPRGQTYPSYIVLEIHGDQYELRKHLVKK